MFSCGFDSIPFDLGVVYLQDAALARFGRPLVRVRGRVRVLKGTFSGGTMASALASIAAMGRDPELARSMADPFALAPGFRGPAQPESDAAQYDEVAKAWSAPFVMAPINTKNVHRTHALLGHPWGRDFTYDERMLTGEGERGKARATSLARKMRVQEAVARLRPQPASSCAALPCPSPARAPAARRASPAATKSCSSATRPGASWCAVVKGDRDPGYGSTCKLVAESALCLVEEIDRGKAGGGVWTPGAAMGLTLARRLGERAGLGFALEE